MNAQSISLETKININLKCLCTHHIQPENVLFDSIETGYHWAVEWEEDSIMHPLKTNYYGKILCKYHYIAEHFISNDVFFFIMAACHQKT